MTDPISPTLHPDSVLHGAPDVPAMDEVRATLSAVYGALGRLHEAQESVGADPTLTDAAKIHEAEKLRASATERINGGWDKAGRILARAIESAETRLRESVRPAAFTAAAAEIRGYVRSLPREERLKFLSTAARSGDRETVHAILSTRPYLSGLDHVQPEEWDAVRGDTLRKLAPEVADELDRLRATEARVNSAMGAYASRYLKSDPRAANIAKHVERRLKAAS